MTTGVNYTDIADNGAYKFDSVVNDPIIGGDMFLCLQWQNADGQSCFERVNTFYERATAIWQSGGVLPEEMKRAEDAINADSRLEM